MFTYENLSHSLFLIGLPEDRKLFSELQTAYSETHRHYHNSAHISECLALLQEYRHLAKHLGEVELAIWFHDAVYQTKQSDNEEKSASWAADYLESVNAEPGCIQRINNMIIATKIHQPTTVDSKLMIDVDLSILGSPEPVFEQYDLSIRKEYYWVPEIHYRTAREHVLKSFLQRKTIFHTHEMRAIYEQAARQNITRKIMQLSA